MKHSLLIIGFWLFSVIQSRALAHETTMATTAGTHTMEHIVYYGAICVALFAVMIFLKAGFLRRGWPGAKR